MSDSVKALVDRLSERFGDRVELSTDSIGQPVVAVPSSDLIEVMTELRDGEGLRFDLLTDVCGLDLLWYGHDEWRTNDSTRTGYSRARRVEHPPLPEGRSRFEVIYHLLSVELNQRIRVRCACPDDDAPMVPSVTVVWSGADWFEREAFDLFGILFDGHPDLRRILTDYGFIGHPFRKDFPLSGEVEVRYDPEQGRVIYQPRSITPRVTQPKVIRPEDNRYLQDLKEGAGDA